MNDKELTKYIHAFALGDGCLSVDKREYINNPDTKAWFSTVKTEKNKDFIDFAESILSSITRIKVDLYEGKNGTKPFYRLTTMRHPIYTTIRKRMYIDNKKSIDPHYMTLMDWETLAILFMDDGTAWIQKDKKPYNTYYYGRSNLCTHAFSYGDNLVLATAIKEKLDLHYYVRHKNYKTGTKYFLELSRKDNGKFVDGVSKFILPSFEYKLESFDMTNSSEKEDEDIV